MIRTNDSKVKTTLKAAVLLTLFLLFAAAPGFAQQVINLTAGPNTTTLPDGTVLPMWGYTCGAAAGGTTTATCAPLSGSGSSPNISALTGALGGIYVLNGGSGYTTPPSVTITPALGNTPTTPAVATAIVSDGAVVGFNLTTIGAGYTAAPTITLGGPGSGAVAAAGPAWSPVLITVPYVTGGGTSLTINLTNNLSFTGGNIPTSIQIVGQVGGGLGTSSSFTASPNHADAQGCVSWFIAGSNVPPGQPCTTSTPLASPPIQGQRVQSMATEVAAGAPGTATTLTWASLKPGTYLIESGTHPSIQVPMGLIGMLVVTTAPSTAATAGTAYPAATPTNKQAIPAVTYSAEVPLEFSEIDPVQNRAVDLAVRTVGFSETAVWTAMNNVDGAGGKGCGQASVHTCYPPAVNYTPFYYLINGLAFDRTHPGYSQFVATTGAVTTPPTSGTILMRMVNAGLRMHVPSTVGSLTTGFNGAGASATVGGFTLIAEDGNPLPDLLAPRVQTDVFMAAGKTYDVMVNVPATPAGASAPPSLPVYDRELSLSANSSVRDSGMLAYVGVSGAALPASVGGSSGVFAAAQANPDVYNAVALCLSTAASCTPLVVSDASKGLIANDVNVNGVALSSPPANGTLSCNALPGSPVAGICANGTFTYTPNVGSFISNTSTDSFGYCANGAGAGTANLCTIVTLNASSLTGSPTAIAQSYTSKMGTFIKIAPPGLLAGNSDPNKLPLTVALSSISLPACTSPVTAVCGTVDQNGGFTLAIPTPPTTATIENFTYKLQNSQGSQSTTAGTVTVTFPVPSNLQVHVVDGQQYSNCNLNSTCISGLTQITDYRWIIEEDKTFWVDPNCTTNSSITTPGCPNVVGSGTAAGQTTIPTFAVNFHTSNMDFVAQGCTGPLACESGQTMLDNNPSSLTYLQHIAAVCDVGAGACRPDTTGNGSTPVFPSQVVLDPSKRYYISVLPGDAANPFPSYVGQPNCVANTNNQNYQNNGECGHTMGGASIPPACNVLGGPNACTTASAFTQPVTVLANPTPLTTGRLSAIVFEDDYPLNGEQDSGGGGGTSIAPIEPGLGGFNLVLWDTYGTLGDVTGQDSNDMFNQPLSNSLAGTQDPVTGLNACPISENAPVPVNTGAGPGATQTGGVTGMIVTCPKFESDGTTLSPLAGQVVIDHLMPEKFSVQAYPGADRIARGEQWVQTNTLDGQHPHDAFIRAGEPAYFQEYGPAGYHVAIGFANPAIINARHNDVCQGLGSPGQVGSCSNTIDGQVDVQRLSRTPDERLYPSGSRDALTWTQCWVSLGDPDGEDFEFTFCDANGNFRFTNVPGGNWRLTVGDQWNDQIIDGLSTPANVGCLSAVPNQPTNTTTCPGGQTLHMGNMSVPQWQQNVYTRTFIDDNKNGILDPGEIGIPLIYTMVHYRDGHNANALVTDFNGVANFNETFPLFNWYVVEADSTRYKTTGTHTVYDAGGPTDGSPSCGPSNGARQCGTSTAYNFLTNTFEGVPLPADLSVPGAVYCQAADCTTEANADFVHATPVPSSSTTSTGRIDSPWFWAEGWQGMMSGGDYIEIGKAPYASCPPACATVTATAPGSSTATTTQVGENGGIYGQVAYASTRPFDDASQMIQQPWEPNVPNVTVNLYQEGFAADGVTPTLTLVDTTQTTSWDAWAQGFYPNTTAGTGTGAGQKPYMSCPGQGTNVNGSPNQDLFYFTIFDQPEYLDWYNSLHNGGTLHTMAHNSEFKCYDSMHMWDQVQPAPYDGKYFFPSVLGISATTGKPDASLVGGVGVPVWSNAITYTAGATVMYQGIAYAAATVSTGVAPGTAAAATVWTATTTPASFAQANMGGTNCTICVANPDATDPWRQNTPMLPPGKYVVQVVMPPGYEVYKEEDKNLLIGDNFIAPVTQEFAGLGGDVFILPDQASVASMYDPTKGGVGYNPNNFQNQTTGLGLNEELSGVPGFPGYTDPVWPCVGEMRVVPDYLSLFPLAKEVAPFAGATRPICDRKEVTLNNQMAVNARFFIYTSTHIASKFTGVITDDFTSEFDPFAPMFGEKFSPPNMPIATRDFLGNEISRVYSDHWGIYDGLTYSSWEVNPPNITGYSPSMMVQCMNDPGPILDNNPSSPTFGQLIVDPLFNPAYSDFCYEDPFMPGLTTYNDTPVVPTEAFIGAGYNNPDCGYPDTTPAIKEVDGQDGIGPWVSAVGHTLTITALGDQQVNNSAYSGPSANTAPFNLKTINHHYGFGSQCTTPAAGNTSCNTLSSVTIGGVPASINSWSDTQVVVTVPGNVPFCTVQQQTQYQGSQAQCGELLITAGNGRQSIDAVTVTIGGKAPTHVNASSTIQGAIDAAAPGDLIIVDPTCATAGTTTTVACNAGALHSATPTQTASVAAHYEMLLMWKPVRLQGVGAVSSIIDANATPAGKLLDPWRRHVNCLFGLTLQGSPIGTVPNTGAAPVAYDPSNTYSCPDAGWNYFVGPATAQQGEANVTPQVDRLPLEAAVGWDATVNGNLAEQLQEPSLMGAYEGAGITVLAKGVWVPQGVNPWTDGTEAGGYPITALLLQNVPAQPPAIPNQYSWCTTDATTGAAPGTGAELKPNPYPSNFECNPSSIDGITIRNSSQGGGGIFVHGWAHFLQIANNRVYNNAGTLSGGITVGQGEFPPAITISSVSNGVGQQSNLDAPPSCGASAIVGTHLPYCMDMNVNVHHNSVTANSGLGDELFSGTLAGGGGVTFCTGADYYKFNYNWVCGNISSGEGGGFAHVGFIYNGDIEHNSIVINQATNPTIPTDGGGIQIMGTPDTDPVCGTQNDQDCPSGLSDGTGPGLVINANLIQGNAADSGSGGGIRLQQVNGTDVSTFPSQPTLWNTVNITNNIVVNNIAGWDGAGISLQDSLNVNIVNNTIAHNDSLATSGVLTQTVGAPMASAPAGNCVQNGPGGPRTASCPQSSGLTSVQNSTVLTTTFTGLTITCPPGHFAGTATNGTCTQVSYPALYNDLFYQNRAFYIGVGNRGQGTQNQQNLVTLFNAFSGTGAPVQTSTGSCTSGVTYWDIGVRGDLTLTGHESGYTIGTHQTMTTSGGGRNNGNNVFVSQYCNGSRVPPECSVSDGCGGPSGYGVPPGIADSTAPNPVFSLTPAATVDEGNNWINVSWGPMAMSNESIQGPDGNYGGGPALGNYALAPNSPAIDGIDAGENLPSGVVVPASDFFGNPRPNPDGDGRIDFGAVETQADRTRVTPTLTSIIATSGPTVGTSSGLVGTSVNVTLTGTNLLGASAITVSGNGVTVSDIGIVSSTTVVATFTIAPNARLGSRNVAVVTPDGTTNTVTFTINAPIPSLSSIAPAFGERGTIVPVVLTGTNLAGTTAVMMSGGGIACTVTGTTATTVNASCMISRGAGLTNRNVTVPGSTNNLIGAFRVTGATLTISAPTPAMNSGGTSTKTGTITVTNTATGATAGAFTFTAGSTVAKTSGSGNGTFSIVAPATGTACTATTVLAPGSNCTIGVQYAGETNTSTANGRVTVTGNGLTNATATSANIPAN